MASKEIVVTSVGYGGSGPFSPVTNISRSIMEAEHLVANDDQFQILILHGGEDISPELYKAEKHERGNGSVEPSFRDKREVAVVNRAIELGIPIFGICRGAQLLCAMAGGDLFQHVHGHHGTHKIRTKDGRILETSSIHHQMMNPFDMPADDYELIAWAEPKLSDKYYHHTGDYPEVPYEPEVIWFPKIKGFAVQGHPEGMPITDDFVNWCRSEFFKRTI